MRRFVLVLVLSLTFATGAHARPVPGPVQSNRICGHLVEVNRDTYRWAVATDPTIWRDQQLFVTGRASSRFAAWMWGRAVANLLGGCA